MNKSKDNKQWWWGGFEILDQDLICVGSAKYYGHLMLHCFHDIAAALPGWVDPHASSPDWQWEHSYAMLHSCSITQSSSSM